jgi:hypothetical protein
MDKLLTKTSQLKRKYYCGGGLLSKRFDKGTNMEADITTFDK